MVKGESMKKFTWFYVLIVVMLLAPPIFGQTSQLKPDEPIRWDPPPPFNGKTEGAKESDLITPLNLNPISIDEALDKRLKVFGRPVKNSILLIVDGMGASSIRLARDVIVGRNGRLEIDKFPVIGRMVGYPLDGPVNDSAAAASAMATGKESPLRAISLDKNGKSVQTILEAARAKGFKVGIVSDTNITHATPAAFASHVSDRYDEPAIAGQIAVSDFHLFLGGGRKFFIGKEAGGMNLPGTDLLKMAGEKGFRVVGSKKELVDATSTKAEKVLGVFNEGFMPEEWEKTAVEQPSLAEMSAAALSILRTGDKGFFLVVEAGKVDIANHFHDAAKLITEMRSLEETLRVLSDFVRCNSDSLLVVVSDHGTGGIDFTEKFDVEKFRKMATSTMNLSKSLKDRKDRISTVLHSAFPGLEFSEKEISRLLSFSSPADFDAQLGTVVFEKLGLSYYDTPLQAGMKETLGHSGEDLFIHALGAHQGAMGGVIRIWEIPSRLAAVMGFTFPEK